MWLSQSLLVAFALALCIAFPCQGVVNKGVVTENEMYRVSLIETLEKQGHYGQNVREFTFRVVHKPTGSESAVTMENMTTDIERVEIVNDRMLVVGDQNLKDITLIDLKQGKEIDFFYGFGPQLSETRRYLLYQKFYHGRGMEPTQSDLLLLYDLTASPEENRVEKKYKHSREKSQHIGDPAYQVAAINVGRPIYPPENVTQQSYFVWVPAPEERHQIVPEGEYLWLENDSKVVFVDKTGGEVWLVAVDLSHGLAQVQSKKKLIDVASLIDIPKVMELDRIADPETALRDMKERIPIMGLRQKAEGNIVISIEPDWRYKATEIEMPLP